MKNESLPCIKCGESGNVLVNVDDGESIFCRDCDLEYTASDVKELIERWGPILLWMDAHPARAEGRPKIAAAAG